MNEPRILFLADQFLEATRDDLSGHPGGAELDDDAAIKASPWPVEPARAESFHPTHLRDFDLHVVANLETAPAELIEGLCEQGRHVLYEHDVRICRWRGNFPGSREYVHKFLQRCICPHQKWRALYQTALGAIFLTQRQMRVFQRNPFFQPPRSAIIGATLMNEAFFERVERVQSDSRERDIEAAILGSGQHIKGTEAAQNFCLKRGVDPFVIRGLEPEEVLDMLERCQTFVYLPEGLEPAGRMLVEARFLGCGVVANAHTGICGELWWNLPDDLALEFVRDAPLRFWRLVARFAREANAGRSDSSSSAWNWLDEGVTKVLPELEKILFPYPVAKRIAERLDHSKRTPRVVTDEESLFSDFE